MSWLEKVEQKLIIRCGDGKEYEPNYLNPQKSVEYNIAEFNFPNIDGTLVKRKAPRGRRYPIEFYFQGKDHLTIAADFERSAKDTRPWSILHPYYDQIVVQPASLTFDNTQHNVSKVTGVLIETIEQVRPSATESPIDTVVDGKVTTDESIAEAYANNVTPTASDTSSLQQTNEVLYAEAKSLASEEEGASYFNAFSEASAAIATATSEPLQAMVTLQAMISAPARFVASVKDRNNVLVEQFNRLVNTVVNLTTPNEKRQFQATGGTLMTSLAESSVNGDYITVQDVLVQIEQVLDSYDLYLTSLDSLQTLTGGQSNSYIPDPDPLFEIDEIVNESVSSLFDIALDAQQERIITLECDDNAVNLAHRFYELDSEDENLVRFINTNNLGLHEYLLIRKGTQIVYYV